MTVRESNDSRAEVLEVSRKDSSTWVNGITQTRREPLHHGPGETNTETRPGLEPGIIKKII